MHTKNTCMSTNRSTANGDGDEDMEDITDVMELDYNNDSSYDSLKSIGKLNNYYCVMHVY